MTVQHLLTSFNSRFYATVYSAASFASVVSNRGSFAVAYSVYALSFNAVLVNQYCTNSVCTALRQFLVVGVRTNGVSVTFHGGASQHLDGVAFIFRLHLVLGMTLFLLFPFSRLVHIWSVPVEYLTRKYQIVRARH